MTFLGGIQGRHLPGQVVIPRPSGELVHTHGHTPERGIGRHGGHAARGYVPACIRCVEVEFLEIEGGTRNRFLTVRGTADRVGCAWSYSGIHAGRMGRMGERSVRQSRGGQRCMIWPHL